MNTSKAADASVPTAPDAAEIRPTLPLRAFEWVAAGSVFTYLAGPWRTDVSDFLVLSVAAITLFLLRRRLLPSPPARRTDRAARIVLLAFTLFGTAALGLWGLAVRGHPFRPWSSGVTFLAYLPFAAIQQYLSQRYLTGRICAGLCRGAPAWTPLLSGILFGLCHVPWPPIHAITTVAGCVWAWCWLRTGRTWDLAVSHALLATTLFSVAWGFDTLAILRWPMGG